VVLVCGALRLCHPHPSAEECHSGSSLTIAWQAAGFLEFRILLKVRIVYNFVVFQNFVVRTRHAELSISDLGAPIDRTVEMLSIFEREVFKKRQPHLSANNFI